jgi:hypothetical protein
MFLEGSAAMLRGMTVAGENPNCAATYASFRLAGDGLVTAEVTRQVGLEPDFAAEKGEVRGRVPAGGVRQPTGVWSISSERRLHTTNIERHLICLLDILETQRPAVLAVAEQQGLEADFFCYWVSATGHGGPELSAETLTRIAVLNASLGFDFYDGSSGSSES